MVKVKKRYLIPALAVLILAAVFVGANIYFSRSNVTVYMYHSVRELPVNPEAEYLSVRPEEFEKQLEYFTERKMETIFASELAGELSEDAEYLVLTFDDGYEDNYTEVFPLLKKYNCKATIFMITSRIGKEGYLSADQIREMTESGLVSVQSHTMSHDPLALGDKVYEEVDYELASSKAVLERISGERVNCISMPNGSFDEVVLEIARNYYDVIFTGTGLRSYTGEDIQDVYRAGIYRRHTIEEVKEMTGARAVYIIRRGLEKLIDKL